MSFEVKKENNFEEYLILLIICPPVSLASSDQDAVSGLFTVASFSMIVFQ